MTDVQTRTVAGQAIVLIVGILLFGFVSAMFLQMGYYPFGLSLEDGATCVEAGGLPMGVTPELVTATHTLLPLGLVCSAGATTVTHQNWPDTVIAGVTGVAALLGIWRLIWIFRH